MFTSCEGFAAIRFHHKRAMLKRGSSPTVREGVIDYSASPGITSPTPSPNGRATAPNIELLTER